MQLAPPGTPLLSRYPVLRSDTPEEVEDALVRVYGAKGFDLDGPEDTFQVRADHWQSQAIGLSYCKYGTAVTLDFPAAGFYRQQFCLAGAAQAIAGQRELDVSQKPAPILPAGVPLRLRFNADFEQIILRVDEGAVHRAFQALYGYDSPRRISFPERAMEDTRQHDSLCRLLRFYLVEISEPECCTLSPLLAETENLIVLSFVLLNLRDFSSKLTGTSEALPKIIRRAEDYIDAHWSETIIIERLCQLTGVSARTLFHNFRHVRGYTPLTYVRQVRLRHARAMLLGGIPGTTVTHVAFACGFSNLGHFARAYFETFGEKPSETLRRRAGLRPGWC